MILHNCRRTVSRDDIFKRVPVKPQMVENNVENVMETWHSFFSFFSSNNFRKITVSSWPSCIHLLPFSFSSVEQKLQWTFKSHGSCTSWFILWVCFHFTFFYAHTENTHKNKWLETHLYRPSFILSVNNNFDVWFSI